MFRISEFSDDATYGYTEANPIMVGGGIESPRRISVERTITYLNGETNKI